MTRLALVSMLIFSLSVTPDDAKAQAAENLIIVTLDGLRWQELYRGIDQELMASRAAGVKRDADHDLMKRLWDDDPKIRRARLFPYFWGQLAGEGILYGNRDLGSEVSVTNNVLKSLAGYAEILTGQALDSVIKSNAPVQMPVPTILEMLKLKWELKREDVALFASWARFHHVAARDASQIVLNAGYDVLEGFPENEKILSLNRRQFEQLTPWTEVRHDYITCELALEYMRMKRPRVLYLGLGETDDWAHDRRYPRVAWAASYSDTCLQDLMTLVESSAQYRSKTLLVITTDHGRGRTQVDWSEHKKKVPGSDEIWVYLRGPGVSARGEVKGGQKVEQRDIVPSVLKLLGQPTDLIPGSSGRPVLP